MADRQAQQRPRQKKAATPSMEDVARQAGVALGTVSNVINQRNTVTKANREKVLLAIAQLGYVRNRAARSLAGGTSNTIGFVLIDLSNTFFLDMTRGAERAAQEAGMAVLLANSDLEAEKQDVYLNVFDEERVAGMLLAPIPQSVNGNTARIRDRGGKVVLLNDGPVSHDGCCVLVNNEHGGYLAAKHLIETGRRRLLFAGGPDTLAPIHDRHEGVKRAVADTKGAVSLEYLPTKEVQVSDGRKVGHALAGRPARRRPDGIIAVADLLALGMLQSLVAETDIRIPRDMGIIGYDNNRSAWDSSVIPISTISQPGEQMGRVATELLIEEIRDPDRHIHRRIILEPTLIARESSVSR